MNIKVKIILLTMVFIICIGMIWYGQRTVGYGYLGLEVLGLIGILVVIYCYNRQYR